MGKANPSRRQQKGEPHKSPVKFKGPAIPVWQSPFFWLILLPVLLYAKIIFFDFTALDDQFFVIDQAAFNHHPGSLAGIFSRGLFVPENDIYYRPVFLVDMIIENHLFGIQPWGYHLTSLLFHLVSVCLLFVFLKKIRIPETASLMLSLLFSIHPVLTQTVAWIPGRNDLILMIFFLATLICVINYYQTKKIYLLIAQFFTFLLALLTKETAVIIPVISVLLLRFVFSVKISRMLPLFGTWALALIIWYGLRASSDPSYQGMLLKEMIQSGMMRIPSIIQYLGKIFFPVNLSAVPMFEEITLLWGCLAIALLVSVVAVTKTFKKPLAIIGLLWFLLFLLPVLLVPKQLNDQVYEHRLYLPFIGILLILSQPLQRALDGQKRVTLMVSASILSIFLIASFFRLDCYHDRKVFWDKAVADSPGSSFARLNQGIQSKDPVLRERYVRMAYALNPNEMLVNYWMGITSERNKKIDSAVFYYKKELAWSNFPDLYFNLSRALFTLNHLDSAAWYLSKGVALDPTKTAAVGVLANVYFKLAESAYKRSIFDSTTYYLRQVITFDPKNPQANHNLAMVCFQTGHRTEALQVLENMRLAGLSIPKDLLDFSK